MHNKLALITGASSGVGAATAQILAQQGWHLILTARDATRLAKVCEDIGNDCVYFACDLATPEGAAALKAFILQNHQAPDLVVNSAGLGQWKHLEETSPEEAQLMMSAPYFTAFNASQMFIEQMLQRNSGTLIHINSPACFMPWPCSVGYASARFALRGLHEALVQDLAGSKVKSCHVVFGKIDSEYFVHNPGVEEVMPGIAITIPVLSTQRCATIIAKLANKPKHQSVYPFMLRFYYWSNLCAPWLTRFLLRITGAKR